MKHYLLLLVYASILFAFTGIAQEPLCRVGGEDTFIQLLRQDWDQIRERESDFLRNAALRTNAVVNLPVQFHVVRSSVGETTVTASTLERSLDVMNQYFQQAGLRFYQCGAPRFVDDSNLRDFFIARQSSLTGRSYTEKVVNIYCVRSIEGGTVGGYTYLPGSGQPDLIVMDERLLLNATLTHEMGHFFGLLHTHGASNCPESMPGTDELADGSNCAVSGDLICDTPADPGLLGAGCTQYQVDLNCNYIGVARDAKGQLFNPDVFNVMSYSRSSCRNRLSPGQYARMNATYFRYRAYLSCGDTTGPKPPTATYARLSMESPAFLSPNPVKAGQPFTIAAQFRNTGDGGFTGKIRATLFNRQDQQLATIATIAFADTLKPGATTSGLITFSNPNLLLSVETYKIGLYYQTDSSAAYQLVGNEKYSSFFSFSVEGAPLGCSTPDSIQFSTGVAHLIFSWKQSPVQAAFYRAAYREKGKTAWSEIPNWSAARMVIVNRKPCTAYEFRVKTVCPEGESEWSPIVTAFTTGCNEAYCLSYGNSLRSFIQEVQIGFFKNASGNDYGFGDFTHLRAEVQPGGFVGLTLTPGMHSSETVRTVYWRIWADFNRNNAFDESGELLFQGSELNTRAISAAIQLPANLAPGGYRLRVSLDTREFPSPCATNDYREVEDYTLWISGGAVLRLSSSALEFLPDASAQPLGVESSGPWTVQSAPAWVMADPASGTQGQTSLQIKVAANPDLTRRQGTVQFEAGNARVALQVRQLGRLLSRERADFSFLGAVQSLRINADTSWAIDKKPDWITVVAGAPDGIPGVVLTLRAEPNPKDAERLDTLYLRWSDGRKAVLALQQDSNKPPSAWGVTPTPTSHLIILSDRLRGDFGGEPLQAGDYIGFFYSDGQREACAGMGLWTGTLGAFTVFGDNPATPQKDGMAPGENFRVRVWRLRSQTELKVAALFADPIPVGVPSHGGRYATNGISRLEELFIEPSFTFTWSLKAGYNLFGIPLMPETLQPFEFFAPLNKLVRDMQDARNARVDFETGMNTIGDLDVRQGYIVFVKRDTTLRVNGHKILPSKTPIVLEAGWHLAPLWSLTPRPVHEAMGSLLGSLVMVKDHEGRTYLPDYGINTLGNLEPGKAYWVFLTRRDTLVYPDAYMSEPVLDVWVRTELSHGPEIFRHERIRRTLESTVVVIRAQVLDPMLEFGDELGIYSPQGVLCGSALYEGKNLAITAYGITPGTPFELRAWKRSTGETVVLKAQYREDWAKVFEAGGIAEVHTLEALPASSTASETGWKLYPNPAWGQVTLERAMPHRGMAQLIHPDGRIIRQWILEEAPQQNLDLAGLPAGLYFLQWRDNGKVVHQGVVLNP